MNPQTQKTKVFFRTAVVLSALGTVLYTMAHLLATDGSGFFTAGHPLPMIANILSGVSVLWFACALILIPKDALPSDDFMKNKSAVGTVSIAPIIGALASLLICFTMRTAPGMLGLCAKLGIVAALVTVAYLALRLLGCNDLSALLTGFGIGPILLYAALCGVTYFDQSVYMNSPVKMGFQLAFIATMLFMTAEIRFSIGVGAPRKYLALACMALYANCTAAIPQAVYLFRNQAPSYENLSFAVLCLGNAVYLIFRLWQFTKFCNPIAPQIDDQIPGKDTSHGCQ